MQRATQPASPLLATPPGSSVRDSSEVEPHFLSRCIYSCSRLYSCVLSFLFLCCRGWRVAGPCPIQNVEMDGACFLYASLSFYVHEDFGLSSFPLLIADAYSSVYCDASRSRKRRGFFPKIDSYSPVESEFRDDPYILCFQLFRVSCSFRFVV